MLAIQGHRILCKSANNAEELIHFIKMIMLIILTDKLSLASAAKRQCTIIGTAFQETNIQGNDGGFNVIDCIGDLAIAHP